MPVAVRIMSLPVTPEAQQSFDVYELASEAADGLEAYQRAPWRQLSDRTRMAKLRQAIELTMGIEDLEAGRIPVPIWGD